MSAIKKFTRFFHRWVGLLIGVPLLFWTISGAYFSWMPIEQIRGEHLTQGDDDTLGALPAALLSPQIAMQRASVTGVVEAMKLIRRDGRLWYRFEVAHLQQGTRRYLIDALTGMLYREMDQEAAIIRAQQSFLPEAKTTDMQLITALSGDSEVRGRPLPLWRVTMDYRGNPVLYFDAYTGELVATRTDYWRIFDFLWMLHILDFDARSDFNQPLLQTTATIALVLVVSGYILFFMTQRRRRKIQVHDSD